ncbi:hypothetical protein K474DRAFT_1366211 [Panus rudis PR-1116 ss-1]|nr:hypothetical protein K474DRAFT_1366211 [Panus rudis PR-1116 ss-1]
MRMFGALFFSILAVAPSVYAHGFLGQVAVDGKWYAGNVPNNYQGPSPIRLVNDIGPVKGSSNPDLMCGLSAQKAEMVVSANPGSQLTFQWSGGAGQKWPHNTGPLITYMASCGSTSCDQFDPSGAKWFKIDQVARNSDGQWYQQDIMQGKSYTITLPNNIAPGGYLVRHEIIALHLAVTMGGAEFYPSCTQIQIGGNGDGKPDSTVSFPGAYSDSDPGIYDPNIYDTSANYTFPGGPLSNLAASSDSITPAASGSAAFPSGTGSGSGQAAPTSPANNEGDGSGSLTGGVSKPKCSLRKKDASAGVGGSFARHYYRSVVRSLKGLRHYGSSAASAF